MPKPKKSVKEPLSTRESLSGTIKTIRNIMRKDKGLNGDLDRLPMLTWLMFLKFLDDSDELHRVSDELAGRPHVPLIEEPYRWRDWAGIPEGLTGPELIAFINQDEAIRPDGTRGPGLFAYLKTRSGGRGDVLANVFRELQNRMSSGYLLRDVVNKISEISFGSSESIHTLSHLYESMLKEMRDAAGDSGEFYTPRPVVKFMIKVLDPKLGEKVLDPACGTGGFLVEAYEHMKAQAIRAEHFRVLQEESLFGNEAKSLPYLLAQMNLVLHGVESPNITVGNSLAVRLNEIGDAERVDVIATNPPFGGEEERSIQDGFPADKRTPETALLFLQLIMRRLKRGEKVGRAAVVVPDGTLFGDGVSSRIKEQLVREFNLHTVVRLPAGTFAPYTPQATNILFFDRSASTKGVWYYEHPLPDDRATLKNPCYTKEHPIRYDELEPILDWWTSRTENNLAWYVPVDEIEKKGFSLDFRNPSRFRSELATLAKLTENAERASASITRLVDDYVRCVAELTKVLKTIQRERAGAITELGIQINPESCNPQKSADSTFVYIDLASVNRGVIEPKLVDASDAPSRARRVVRTGDVLLSTVRPYLMGHAVVPESLDGAIASTGFACLRCSETISPEYLWWILSSPIGQLQFEMLMRGSHYPALNDSHIRSLRIPCLQREVQDRLMSTVMRVINETSLLDSLLADEVGQIRDYAKNWLASALSEAGFTNLELQD